MASPSSSARRGSTSTSTRGLKSWDALEARRSVPISFNLVPSRRSRVKPTVGSTRAGRESQEGGVGTTWLCPILQAHVNGAIVIRILDPEHKEPFVGLGGIFEAAGLSIVEGLLRFNLRRERNDFDITLAGVEPFDEIWASLSMARAIADDLNLLERLAALLSWSSRHAWSLDEGEAGLIHNWRAPASVIEPSIYSTAALLTTSMPKLELIPRGEQIRTLLSRPQRQAAVASDSAPLVSQMRCRLLNWSVRCYEALLELIEEEGWENIEEGGQMTPTGKKGDEKKETEPPRDQPTPGLPDLVTLLHHLTTAGAAQRDDDGVSTQTEPLVAGPSAAWHQPLSIAQGRLALSAEEMLGVARPGASEPSSPASTARGRALLDARLRLAEVHLLWKTARMLLVPAPAGGEEPRGSKRAASAGTASSPAGEAGSHWPSSPLSASEALGSPTTTTSSSVGVSTTGEGGPGMHEAKLEATLERLDRRMRRSTMALDRIHQLLLDATGVSTYGGGQLRLGKERSGSGSSHMSIGRAAQQVARTSVEARQTGNLVALWGAAIVLGLLVLQIIAG